MTRDGILEPLKGFVGRAVAQEPLAIQPLDHEEAQGETACPKGTGASAETL